MKPDKLASDLALTFILLCFCAVLFVAIVRFFRCYLRAHNAGDAVEGVLVANERSSGSESVALYTPLVEFRTRDGVCIKAKSALSTSWKKAPGTKLRLVYDPKNPSIFFVVYDRLVPVTLVIGGVISMLVVVTSAFRFFRLLGEWGNW